MDDFLDDAIAANFIQGLKDSDSMEYGEREKQDPIDPEQIHQRITSEFAEVISTGLEALAKLKDKVVSSADPDSVSAFSTVMAATTNAVAELNKINLEKQRSESREQLEDKRHEHKKEQMQLKRDLDGGNQLPGGSSNAGNVNILVATRDEILRDVIGPLEGRLRDTLAATSNQIVTPAIDIQTEVIDALNTNVQLASEDLKRKR